MVFPGVVFPGEKALGQLGPIGPGSAKSFDLVLPLVRASSHFQLRLPGWMAFGWHLDGETMEKPPEFNG